MSSAGTFDVVATGFNPLLEDHHRFEFHRNGAYALSLPTLCGSV